MKPPMDVASAEVCVALQRSMELNKRRFAASQFKGCRMKAAISPDSGTPVAGRRKRTIGTSLSQFAGDAEIIPTSTTSAGFSSIVVHSLR